jgi:hypothetical protein
MFKGFFAQSRIKLFVEQGTSAFVGSTAKSLPMSTARTVELSLPIDTIRMIVILQIEISEESLFARESNENLTGTTPLHKRQPTI